MNIYEKEEISRISSFDTTILASELRLIRLSDIHLSEKYTIPLAIILGEVRRSYDESMIEISLERCDLITVILWDEYLPELFTR